jgi:uncharacterized RDD family membrane protein YckC
MTPAYAAFGSRLWALGLDAVVGAFGIVAITIVVLLYALIFLYEPLLVWGFGATIGQRAANLRVVDDAHDKLTHTTVQIRGFDRALAGDYHAERVQDAPDPAMPSPLRRIIIIVLYSAGLFLIGIIEVVLFAALFHARDLDVLNNLFALFWIAGTLWVVIVGWQGLLIGARRRPDRVEE